MCHAVVPTNKKHLMCADGCIYFLDFVALESAEQLHRFCSGVNELASAAGSPPQTGKVTSGLLSPKSTTSLASLPNPKFKMRSMDQRPTKNLTHPAPEPSVVM